MRRALTDEKRTAILALKQAMHGRPEIASIDVYRAVIDDGVRTREEFEAWLPANRSPGLTFWRPATG